MYKKHLLKNGLRIITVPMISTKAVTILVLVKTGSKYETPKTSGVSHFLEHMFFKGSRKYPKVRDLTCALDLLGAEYNAFTDKEMTGFWVKVAKPNAKKAVAIVADMLSDPRFPKSEMERERGVILEELNLYFDTPARFIGDLWEKVLYGNQPAGRYVGGTPETVKAIKHKDVVSHFRVYYRAPAIVLTVAGALGDKAAFDIAKKYFAGMRGGSVPGHPKVKEKQLAPQILLHAKKTDQTHIAVGFRGVSLHSPMRHAVTVLAAILGGTMSSRLFLLIRDKLGLAYALHTFAEFDSEAGSLVTIAGVKNSRAHEALDAILKEYAKLLKFPPSASEVRKAQEALVGKFILGVEQTDEIAGFAGTQELLLGNVKMPMEQVRALRAVTPKDVHRAAQKIFAGNRLNLALIGPDKRKQLWYRQLEKVFPK